MARGLGEIEERTSCLVEQPSSPEYRVLGELLAWTLKSPRVVRKHKQRGRWEAGYPGLPKINGTACELMTASSGGGWHIPQTCGISSTVIGRELWALQREQGGCQCSPSQC